MQRIERSRHDADLLEEVMALVGPQRRRQLAEMARRCRAHADHIHQSHEAPPSRDN